ncbi:hypothetical protein L596_009897 [Steinernema carpocapsae]|uniref:Uncharacterized protein n=1 Tax=Steinernema carpocapsae TaxID=34508 RepID=A0A4U5PH67_STECR|nr:hypothetical protein L596_009897 [Steinernema carpocapsae]
MLYYGPKATATQSNYEWSPMALSTIPDELLKMRLRLHLYQEAVISIDGLLLTVQSRKPDRIDLGVLLYRLL